MSFAIKNPAIVGESRTVTRIVVHCSDSYFGDAALIDSWHATRGWRSPSGKSIGYHYVILNGHKDHRLVYDSLLDGDVEAGRPLHEQGAHVAGANFDSIGVCLIGKDGLYTVEKIVQLRKFVRALMELYDISIEQIFAHHELDSKGKTCPDFSGTTLRGLLT